mgnify:CR=1 FL=1
MKSKILGMLIILLFAAGYVTLNYPVFGTLYNQIHEGKVIESYDHTVHTMDKERRKKYLEEAQAYNIMLAKENPQLLDAFSQEAKKSDSVYNRVLNMEESGVMGALDFSLSSDLSWDITGSIGKRNRTSGRFFHAHWWKEYACGFNRASGIAECRTFF